MNKLGNLAVTVVFMVMAIHTSTARAAASGIPYQVLPGDTLSRIAARYHTTVDAFLQANPQVSNPNLIFPGEKLEIPDQAGTQPAITISPANGIAGTQIEVFVDGFPTHSSVTLSVGKIGAESTVFFSGQTDSDGMLTAPVTIPSSARIGEAWIVVATAAVRDQVVQAISNNFIVTQSPVVSLPTNYIVEPGDELSFLAQRYGISVAAILAANPSIRNPNLIFVGQRLFIPGLVDMLPTVIAAPVEEAAGAPVNVTIGGFPANMPVEIQLGKKGSPAAVLENERVNANGNIDVRLSIPATAHVDEEWVVRVNATDGSGISVVSNPVRITHADEAESGKVENYIVQPGDTLSRLASQFDTSLSELLEDNPRVTNPNHLHVGQSLSIRARNPM